MPNITCPHKKEPCYVTARRCTHPAGGWVVLYDRRRGGLAQIQATIKQTGRYILVHRPSKKWAGIVKKAQAMKYLVAVAKGEDVLGILPETVKPPEAALTKP